VRVGESGVVQAQLGRLGVHLLDERRHRPAHVLRERIRRVINGTGIILHTGLGRAVLPRGAIEAVAGLGAWVRRRRHLRLAK